MAIFFLFIICVGGCWLIFKAIGEAIFGKSEKGNTYIDKSIHYHEHRKITVIDEQTKKEILIEKDYKKKPAN